MIKPRRIGHATFETPDLEKAIAYYGEFMGLIVAEREKERAFLATKIGQLVIQLDKADRAHCIKLSFEVAPDSDFGELARELSRDGVRSELRNDSVPGMGQVLSFKDDKGTTIELFKEWNYLAKHAQVAGIGPFKLGHVAFFTPDIQRTGANNFARPSGNGLMRLLPAAATALRSTPCAVLQSSRMPSTVA